MAFIYKVVFLFLFLCHLCLNDINTCGCVFLKERMRSERYIAVALPVYKLLRMLAVRGLYKSRTQRKIKLVVVGIAVL